LYVPEEVVADSPALHRIAITVATGLARAARDTNGVEVSGHASIVLFSPTGVGVLETAGCQPRWEQRVTGGAGGLLERCGR